MTFRIKKITPVRLAVMLCLAPLAAFADDELLMFTRVSLPESDKKAPAAVKPGVPAPAAATNNTKFFQGNQPTVKTVAGQGAPTASTPVNPFGHKASGKAQSTVSTPVNPFGHKASGKAQSTAPVSADTAFFQPAAPAVKAGNPNRVSRAPALTPEPDRDVSFYKRSQVINTGSETSLRRIFYRAVLLANRQSPRLGRARAESEASQQNVAEAKGQRWPQVDVSTSSPTLQFGGDNHREQRNTPAFQVNVATTVYDFGQTSHTIASREASAQAANIAVSAETENLAWEVSSQLIELSKQRRIVMLSEKYVARMKQLSEMLAGIVQADPGRRSELTQARGQLLRAQSSLDGAVAAVRELEISLYKHLGDTKITLPESAEWPLSGGAEASQLASLDSHPVIRSAKAHTQAAREEAKAVRASGLPKLNWVISKDTGKDELGRTQAFETSLKVSWGIFRGGSVRAAERAAILKAEAGEQEAQEQLRDLEYRVRTAGQDSRSLAERADLYHNMVAETDRIRLDFFDQWYHLGKRTLLDVLGAESDYYGNQVSEVTSRYDSYMAIFRGYASAGSLINWLKN